MSKEFTEQELDEKLYLMETKLKTLEVLYRHMDRSVEFRGLIANADADVSVDGNDEENLGEEVSKEQDLSYTSTVGTSVSFSSDEFQIIPDRQNVTISSRRAPTKISSRRAPTSLPLPSPLTRSLRYRFQSRSILPEESFSRSDNEMVRKPSVIEDVLDDNDDYKELSQDTFTLMILSKPFTKQWGFGFSVFILQVTLLLMIGFDQISSSKETTPFDVPYEVSPLVRVGQVLAIILSLATQTDLVMAIATFMMLWTKRRAYWTTLIKAPEHASLVLWATRIAFPITCELIEGLFVLFTTFVIVIQSSNIIDLFKDFAAMQLISELDNMVRSYNRMCHHLLLLSLLTRSPKSNYSKLCQNSNAHT